jgi:hypothetical protein
VYPCTPEVPLASNVNYFAGDISPNSVLAKLSDDGQVCIYSYGTTDVIVDVTGYVPPAARRCRSTRPVWSRRASVPTNDRRRALPGHRSRRGR